jgi:two-component system sensor histidine kinase/response regulator
MDNKPTIILKMLLLFALFFSAEFSLLAQNKKIDSLIVALKNEKSEPARVPILLQLSKYFTSIDPDRKYIYANQVRIIAEKYKMDTIVPIAYLDMAITYGIKTEYDSAMVYFSKGLAVAKRYKVQSQEARAYVCIGYVYDRLDKKKEAIENYKLALAIFKKLKHKKGLNQTYINLGSLYYDMHEYRIADAYFRQALKIAEKANDDSAIAQGYFNLGGTSFKTGNEEQAYQYYMKSLGMREKMNDLNGIALANMGLGELFSKQGKYREAQTALDVALRNNRILENKYQETAVLMIIAKNYLRLKNYKEAQNAAQNALENAKLINSKTISLSILGILTEINAANNNYKKAFDYQSEAIALNDSLDIQKIKNEFIFADFKRIQNEKSKLELNNKVIATRNLTYRRALYGISALLIAVVLLLILYLIKIRQKSKINKVLKLQSEEIHTINQTLESVNEELQVQNDLTIRQNAELERINAVKNKFFSIVSHDLRSPIATLKMLFSTYFEGHLSRDEMNVLLKKLEENIFNTADFLDNLLEWSKSQLEGMVVKPELFQVDRMILRNLKILNAQIAEKKLVVENYIGGDAVAFADQNMINVVIRNIISNSIKFCHEGSSITLNAVCKEDSILISVQDCGIGIHPDNHGKIFQLEHTISQGTSGEKGQHIGLVLCKDMVEQNKGKIWFESTLGDGTTFFIEIPNYDNSSANS